MAHIRGGGQEGGAIISELPNVIHDLLVAHWEQKRITYKSAYWREIASLSFGVQALNT